MGQAGAWRQFIKGLKAEDLKLLRVKPIPSFENYAAGRILVCLSPTHPSAHRVQEWASIPQQLRKRRHDSVLST